MAVCKILLFPDPRLTHSNRIVHQFGSALRHVIGNLNDTLDASPGVGLAAPQIGIAERVSVIDIRRKPSKKGEPPASSQGRIVLINPVLLSGQGLQIPREGCLSVPDLLANVRRYAEVTVKTQTVDGFENIIKSSGFEALALQHEIDHLDGKLFLDRIVNIKTDLFRRQNRRNLS